MQDGVEKSEKRVIIWEHFKDTALVLFVDFLLELMIRAWEWLLGPNVLTWFGHVFTPWFGIAVIIQFGIDTVLALFRSSLLFRLLSRFRR